MNSRYFDTDHHLTEPPDFWTGRFPKKLADRAPRFMQHPVMGPGWSWDGGESVRPMGVQSVGSEDPRKIGDTKSFDDIDPACYDPKKRIEMMDIDGAEVALLFPSSVGFFYGLPDDEFYEACARAYNDASMDWASAGDAKRILPSAMIPISSLEASLEELERTAKKGFRHIMLNQWPSGAPLPTPADDPYWAAIQDLGLTVSVHGFGAGRPKAPPTAQAADPAKAGQKRVRRGAQELIAAGRGAGLNCTETLAGFCMTGVLDRFPKLRLSLVETSLGWLPYLGERMDALYLTHRWLGETPALKYLPSEYLGMFWASFDREWLGVKHRNTIGGDKVTFGTDFPHIGSFYPHSRFYLELLLHDASPEETQKILWGNAAKAYGLA